jgi:ABC-type Mn2+/Zn2+ transport system permease subunit
MEMLGEQFVRYALAASFMIGGLCAFLGVYVILKRIVFMGIALSEVSAVGVAAGLMLGIDPVPCALVLTAAAAALLWRAHRSTTVSKESLIGFVYVVSAALAVILIAKNPAAESRGLDLVSGNLLYAARSDLVRTGILTVTVLLVHLVLYRSFLFVSFDIETAEAAGMRAASYDLLIYLSLGITIGVTMKVAGILFVFGSLVVPPFFALLLFRRTAVIFAAAVLFSLATSFIGVILSITLDWPTSPSALVAAGALVSIAAAVRAVLRTSR